MFYSWLSTNENTSGLYFSLVNNYFIYVFCSFRSNWKEGKSIAVIGSNLTSGSDVIAGSSATTASITPTANNLILLTVDSGIGTGPNIPTATGNGLTWVQVANVTHGSGGDIHRTTVLRAMGSSPSTGAITIDFASQENSDVYWCVDQFSGIDTSGTDGSGAVVQSATRELTAAATSITVTLAAFASTNNATFGGFHSNGSDGKTVGTGFTLLATVGGDPHNISLLTEWKNTNDTSVDYSQTNSHLMSAVAIEIKAAAAVTTVYLLGLLGIGA